jgi:hypothetical protein
MDLTANATLENGGERIYVLLTEDGRIIRSSSVHFSQTRLRASENDHHNLQEPLAKRPKHDPSPVPAVRVINTETWSVGETTDSSGFEPSEGKTESAGTITSAPGTLLPDGPMRDSHHHGNQTKTYRQALPKEIQNTTAGSAKTRAAAKAARTNGTQTRESVVMTEDDRMIANQLGQTSNVENENRSQNTPQPKAMSRMYQLRTQKPWPALLQSNGRQQ